MSDIGLHWMLFMFTSWKNKELSVNSTWYFNFNCI